LALTRRVEGKRGSGKKTSDLNVKLEGLDGGVWCGRLGVNFAG